MTEDGLMRHDTHNFHHLSSRHQSRRYTHTRAGGMFIHTRSDASTLTRSSRLGMGATALYVNCTKGAPADIRPKASNRSRRRIRNGLVKSGNPETTPAAGSCKT